MQVAMSGTMAWDNSLRLDRCRPWVGCEALHVHAREESRGAQVEGVDG